MLLLSAKEPMISANWDEIEAIFKNKERGEDCKVLNNIKGGLFCTL